MIGKYSSLSCSNTVYITSYYNGIAYLYVMIKSGNCITTNLVMENPTDEKNGVEVSIKNIDKVYPYKSALDYIVFFPNIYVEGNEDFNNIKIKKFNNFAVASIDIDSKILLGNVLYPLQNSKISDGYSNFLQNIKYTGIVLKFDVGELNITPNRENIIYTEETINKINKKIADAEKEIEGIITNKINKNYDNLYELYKLFKGSIGYDFLDDSYICHSRYRMDRTYHFNANPNTITFKGYKLNEDIIYVIMRFFNLEVIGFRGLVHSGNFYTSKVPISAEERKYFNNQKILCISNCKRLVAVLKEWIKDYYYDYTIIDSFTKEGFRKYIINNILDLLDSNRIKDKDLLIDWMYDYFVSKVTFIDIDNNIEFQEYKNSLTTTNTLKIKEPKNIILYKQETASCRISKYFKDINHCIEYLKSLKSGIVLANMQDSSDWFSITKARNFVFIKARKDIIKAIEDSHPTFLIDKKYLITKDFQAVKLHTIIKCFKGKAVPTKYSINSLLNTIPKSLKEEFIDIISFYYKYLNTDYRRIVEASCTDTDEYIEYLCKELIKYNDAYTEVCNKYNLFVNSDNAITNLLINTMILKDKVYRVNSKTYNEIKNNKIIRTLCRK